MPRKQRSVDIKAGNRRSLKHVEWKDPPVGHRHHHFRGEGVDPLDHLGLTGRLGLQEQDLRTKGQRLLLDCGSLKLPVPAGGPIGLSKYADQFVAGSKVTERRDPDVTRSGKENAHQILNLEREELLALRLCIEVRAIMSSPAEISRCPSEEEHPVQR